MKSAGKKSAWLIIVLSAILWQGCGEPNEPLYQNSVILNNFPEMADAILNRDFNRLREFTDHDNPAVVSLAYRAMAKSEPNDSAELVREILLMDPGQIPEEMWFVLSFQQLDEESKTEIGRAFESGQILSNRICELFYRQGRNEDLKYLLDRPDLFLTDERCALAASSMAVRTGEEMEYPERLILSAFNEAKYEAANGLLYGFYRASAGGPVINPATFENIMKIWSDWGIGEDSEIDKYMVRILGKPSLKAVFEIYKPEQIYDNIQLSVELAKVAGRYVMDDEMHPAVEVLINHPNPHVLVQLLETLRLSGEPDEEILDQIENSITKQSRNDEVFVESLRLLDQKDRDLDPYRKKLAFFTDRNPYLLDRALPLFRVMESEQNYRSRLLAGLDRGGISSMHSMRALQIFWMEKRSEEHDAMFRDRVLLELRGGNRSVISVIQPVLLDDDLIPDGFAEDIEQAFRNAISDGTGDNANVLRQILEDRFPGRLTEDDIVEPEPFRVPDWQQLHGLGTRPYWILETEKGAIEIRLDPLSAPFTVSSIDSLTRAGLYDDVAFHRVVRNFVIQGGDYDRRDGFGGPDYRIPTEPSFNYYERGSAGIASSGTDTEGAQFFFMHERAPHLDGNYSRFGEIVRGVDVVDKIQVGDKIIRASISVR